jgi:hypothetical protein
MALVATGEQRWLLSKASSALRGPEGALLRSPGGDAISAAANAGINVERMGEEDGP